MFSKKQANLVPYRAEIMESYYAGDSFKTITGNLMVTYKDTGLDNLAKPEDAVKRFVIKCEEEEDLLAAKKKVSDKVAKGHHVSAAKIILGEQDETRVAELERELVTERARRIESDRLLKTYNERASVEDRIAELLVRHVEANPYKPRLAKPNRRKILRGIAPTSIEMMLLVSDAHFPEVVDPLEAMGLSYGPETCRKRMEYLVDRTTRLIDVQRKSGPVGKLTIGVLGDMLSGNIHDELAETNSMVIVDATTEMGYMLYDMGRLLSAEVPEVEMIIIPGNHPRLHKKPRHKKRYDNFEFLMGQLTLAHTVNTGNFTVKVPKDIIYVHRVFDFNIGMTHGDGSKANSFAGIPFYGLKQRSAATQSMRSRLKLDRLDLLCLGHYHQLLTWQEGDMSIIINGSIKGGDEYGIVTRSSAPEAVQALLTFHKDRGWINLAKIPLDHVV